MSKLDHRTAPGSSYFVTTRCAQGRSVLQIPEVAQILVAAILYYRDTDAYLLHEFVVMPNHLHLLLTPGPTTSLEKAVPSTSASSAATKWRSGNRAFTTGRFATSTIGEPRPNTSA